MEIIRLSDHVEQGKTFGPASLDSFAEFVNDKYGITGVIVDFSDVSIFRGLGNSLYHKLNVDLNCMFQNLDLDTMRDINVIVKNESKISDASIPGFIEKFTAKFNEGDLLVIKDTSGSLKVAQLIKWDTSNNTVDFYIYSLLDSIANSALTGFRQQSDFEELKSGVRDLAPEELAVFKKALREAGKDLKMKCNNL